MPLGNPLTEEARMTIHLIRSGSNWARLKMFERLFSSDSLKFTYIDEEFPSRDKAMELIAEADAAILLGMPDINAAVEFGMAKGMGKPTATIDAALTPSSTHLFSKRQYLDGVEPDIIGDMERLLKSLSA